jgi:hypothetical protein
MDSFVNRTTTSSRGSDKIELPEAVTPPSYSTLLEWWNEWPEARPAHLDFWARGNFARRLLSRKHSQRSACIVRAEYLDEIDAALKRLALLDLEVDFVWNGEVSGPQLVIVPQDVDYEDTGGWGYSACAGSEIADRRGGKEWCPSMGWASLLPDSITDWLATEAMEFVRSGNLVVAPVDHVGLRKQPGGETEEQLQKISNSVSLMGERAGIKALFELELPFVDGMTIRDIKKFCDDYKDSLVLFQNALRDIIRSAPCQSEDKLVKELVQQARQGVAELRLSDRTVSARRVLAAVGASIGAVLVTVGLKLSASPGAAVVGSAGAAIATIGQYSQILEARGQMRKNPYYAIWALQRGKGPKNEFRHRSSFGASATGKTAKASGVPPYHWLSPPTPGWGVPTAFGR